MHASVSDPFRATSRVMKGYKMHVDSTTTLILRTPNACCYRLAYMAVPLALENSLWYASNIISTIFIGHLGKHELAAVVLGESVFNVTGGQPVLHACMPAHACALFV